MMLSGSSSYYDDYVRKKGVGRIINDPPSLLTDRGAYVNFLEVQLERVSAACLGVQAYDQRFNDMQQLIVTLEQRCSSTTRLVGLAQQCTEELRCETEQKIVSLQNNMKDDYKNNQVIHQAVSTRLAAVEQNVATLLEAVGRIKILEDRIKRQEDEFEQKLNTCHAENQVLSSRIDALRAAHTTTNETVESLRTITSKLDFAISENDKRVYNVISTLEKKICDAAAGDVEETTRKLHSLSCKLGNDIESLQLDIKHRDSETMATIRKVKESFSKECETFRNDANEFNEKFIVRVNERIADEIKSLKIMLTGKLTSLETAVEKSDEISRGNMNNIEVLSSNNAARAQVVDEIQKKLHDEKDDNKARNDSVMDKLQQLSEKVNQATQNIQNILKQQEDERAKQYQDNLGRVDGSASRQFHGTNSYSGPPTSLEQQQQQQQQQQQHRSDRYMRGPDFQRGPSSHPYDHVKGADTMSDAYGYAQGGPAEYFPRSDSYESQRDCFVSNDGYGNAPRYPPAAEWRGVRYSTGMIPEFAARQTLPKESRQNMTEPLSAQRQVHNGSNIDIRRRRRHSSDEDDDDSDDDVDGGVGTGVTQTVTTTSGTNEDIREIFGQFLDVYKRDQEKLQEKIASMSSSNPDTGNGQGSAPPRPASNRQSKSSPDEIELSDAHSHSSRSNSRGSRSESSSDSTKHGDSSPDSAEPRPAHDKPAPITHDTNDLHFGRRFDLLPAWQPTKNLQPRQWPATIPDNRLPPKPITVDYDANRNSSPYMYPLGTKVLYGDLESDHSSSSSSSSSSSRSTSNVNSSFMSSEILVQTPGTLHKSRLRGAGAILK